jgi:hypothetical protein
MPITMPLEPGETVLLDSAEFGLGVTERAIFLPKKKVFAARDPWFMQRVPRADIEEVCIKRLPSERVFGVSAVMILIGLSWSYVVFLSQHGVSWGAMAALMVGVALPILIPGRFGLLIAMKKGKFKWKPPLVHDKASRDEIRQIFQMIVEACRQARLQVIDEREDPRPESRATT